MKSPQLESLFPGVPPESLDKLLKARFSAELEKAAKNNGGLPTLSQLLKENPQMSHEEINQTVHELAELDEKWQKNSKGLRDLFPLTSV